MGNSINTDKRKRIKAGGEELGYSSGLRKLEARPGSCLRLSFHWGTSFAGDLVVSCGGEEIQCVM
jgi:hypothetical protein